MPGTQDILKVFRKSKGIFLSLVLREIEDVHFNLISPSLHDSTYVLFTKA